MPLHVYGHTKMLKNESGLNDEEDSDGETNWEALGTRMSCDAVVIPAEGFIQLEYLLCKAMERIKQHKEELAKQNVPEREINLMYEKNEIFAHDYIELFRRLHESSNVFDEYIIKRKEE